MPGHTDRDETLTGADGIDWEEPVGLHDHGGGTSILIASGSLRDIARQALQYPTERRMGMTIVSPHLGTLDDLAIIALVLRPGFLS